VCPAFDPTRLRPAGEPTRAADEARGIGYDERKLLPP